MGLLDGLLGEQGSDQRLKLKMGLMGMTHRPNQQLMQQWGGELQQSQATKAEAEKTNKTAQYLRSLGTAQAMQAAAALEAGSIDANTAYQMATQQAPAADPWAGTKEIDGKLYRMGPDGSPQMVLDTGGVDPQSAIAKLAADFNAGLITQEQYDLGIANMAPTGMSVESDGQGGFRMVQGVGVGAGGRPPTEGQLAGAGYLQRMTAAEEIMRSVERMEGVAAIPLEKTLAVDTGVEGYVLNPTEQKIIQAQRDWVRAKLRKESGAVIGKEEMASEIKQYFPQPGEGQEVIAQKAEARRRAERQLQIGAGTAAPQAGEISSEYAPPIRMEDLSTSGVGGATANPLLQEARDAIAKGADPEKVKARLREMGIDPGSL